LNHKRRRFNVDLVTASLGYRVLAASGQGRQVSLMGLALLFALLRQRFPLVSRKATSHDDEWPVAQRTFVALALRAESGNLVAVKVAFTG
jgi:hypothetical protein